jgi:hypothetical protein
MSANETQVGGNHYQSSMQHWDVVSTHNVGYLEGCASKYVSRWRKKNGLQDLQKAVHFTTKLREVLDDGFPYVSGKVPNDVIRQFMIANDLEAGEFAVLRYLWSWSDATDVDYALIHLQNLIREAQYGKPTA